MGRSNSTIKTIGFFAVLLTVSFLILVVPVAAASGDYTIEPAYGSVGIPAHDLQPITFWNLSPREMAIVIALVFFPAFVIPVEIFFMLKVFFFLGFKRIARNNILDNTSRQFVYNAIVSDPGIRISELIGRTGLSRGTVNYHLAILHVMGKIILLRTHGDISYFENSGKYADSERRVLKCLRSDTERQILLLLLTRSHTSRTDLEDALSLSGPTVSWHIKRLSDDGMVGVEKKGRSSSYFLQEKTREYVVKYISAFPVHTSAAEGYATESRSLPVNA